MPKNLIEENIIELLGIAALPDEQKIKLVERMAGLVERRLLARLARDLSDEELKTLEGFDAGGKSESATAFLREKFPNLDDLVREEVERVKREALEAAEKVPAS